MVVANLSSLKATSLQGHLSSEPCVTLLILRIAEAVRLELLVNHISVAPTQQHEAEASRAPTREKRS